MSPSKRMLVFVGSLLLGLTVATQWAATRVPRVRLGFHVNILGRAIYPPWAVLVWQRRLGAMFPGVFRASLAIVALHVVCASMIVLVIGMRAPTVRPMGGDRWAKLSDMQRAGLLSGSGTVVGRFRGRLLTYDGPEHQLVVGASRSGKGVGHVIPTLLTWPGSAVVYDIKGELWEATASHRSKFSHCMFFNPTRLDSARYNPLLEIRKGVNEVRDAQNIAEMLVNPDGSKEQLDIWDQSAAQLIVAAELHVNYTQPDHLKHLGTVRELILDLNTKLHEMIETPHRLNPTTGVPEPHPEIARVARELLQQAPRFAAGVRATAAGYLSLFADPIVCRNVSVSDFAVGDLVCSAHPVTLYLQPPPSDVPRLRPLMRLLLNQICRALLEHLNQDSHGRPKRHQLLLELDEFATLGRLEFFVTNLRQMAAYGVKCHLILQSFNDAAERYGPHNSIIDNCALMVAFACADTTTQQRVSQMTGDAIEYRDSYSHRRWLRFIPESVQKSEHVRPLMQPGDVRMLSTDEQLIFVTGYPPMRTKKVRYYADRVFKNLILPPPDQSVRVDTPRASELNPELGVPHDWMGERAKGERILSDEVLSPLSDDEWLFQDTDAASEPVDSQSSNTKDDYGL